MLSRPSDSGHTPFGDVLLSQSPDLKYWGEHRLVMQRGGSAWWQGVKIGTGPAPIEIDEGWLVFYHGVATTCDGYVYSSAIMDIMNTIPDFDSLSLPENVFSSRSLGDDADTRVLLFWKVVMNAE